MMNKLKQYAENKSSQFGEDGIIRKVFEILPKQGENWCVEFGAWDGKHLSNTYELISNHNWKGVLIEGKKSKFQDLKRTYGRNTNAILINKLIHFEGADTLDNTLRQTGIPLDFDLLSIDIDGNDYHIWESLNYYSPKVVVIEFNPTIPGDVEFVQKKDFTVNHGNSLLSLIMLAKAKGYELIATTICNGFFVKKEFFGLFDITDNSITALWDTQEEAPRIFQLFDGTLVLTREFKLIWGKEFVTRYDLQKLPWFLRYFGDSTNVSGIYKRILRKIYHRLRQSGTKRPN